jgi:hypothetical protein
MSGNPYVVVDQPNYQAPDITKFFNQQPQQQGQQQQQGNTSLMSALQKFLNGHALPAGSAVPGAAGPTSVGGANGPAPLMASGGSPMINSQGLGLY